MTLPELIRPTFVSMSKDSRINEQWLEGKIFDDPSLLGLGDLVVRERQKRQPTGGRLDLLLEDVQTTPATRYEVELQLGATDPSHIIRTIEYWDIEKARYPHYNHIAVIVAEEVTARFLNVIGLFNKAIPLIAIQMKCVEIDGKFALLAARVLDWVPPGIDEGDGGEPADQNTWRTKFQESMRVFDRILEMIQGNDSSIQPNYRKAHISLISGGKVSTAIGFTPQKNAVSTWFKIPHDQELTDRLDEAGLNVTADGNGVYRVKIRDDDVEKRHELLRDLIQRALKNI